MNDEKKILDDNREKLLNNISTMDADLRTKYLLEK